ncbi:glycosyltransferase family 39 protein [Terracidiphilus gabretensis]|uniref:glycosyltransferase family 39 protein n=1 Tax=Terracidiphilus gabretensis TaxID=1577687 RepID=UPI0009E6E8D1|nr:glycosyltransferase family 39 protein [Terracidiphilus gabretensis]
MSKVEASVEAPRAERRDGVWILVAIAVAFAIAHVLTNGRYGFHRDELQFLTDASHLDWGFVPYPPFTAFVEHIGLTLFGLSLIGLRVFSVLAQAVVITVSGLMARDLGGGRVAQVFTALAVGLSPVPVFQATEFQYSSFDLMWWVLIAWFIIRLLKDENPRWWLAIGAAVGLGLETKYSIVFYIAGILVGVVLTNARKYLLSIWFWAGITVALVIFAPNLIWLTRHHFISYTFLQYIHKRDVGEGRAEGFLLGQFMANANLFAAPVWVAGVVAFFLSKRYRMLGWMYLVPVAIFWTSKGRFYYVSGVYPMVLAMGAAAWEQWLAHRPKWAQVTVATVGFAGVAFIGAVVWARLVPIAQDGPLKQYALNHSGDLREEIGWDEMVKTVAAVRDSLPQEQQAHLGIAVGNYGEAGAIEILGPQYHLPPPISTTNSAWLRGYPTPQPTTIIVLGNSKNRLDEIFTGCRWAAHNGNSQGVKNEESDDHPDIYVCGPLKKPWAEFWAATEDFG